MKCNFGHHFAQAGGAFLDAWGSGPFIIRRGRKSWWFEDSDMFGPTLIDKKTHDPKDRQPGERDPFWFAYERWCKGGRKSRAIKGAKGRVFAHVCHWTHEEELR